MSDLKLPVDPERDHIQGPDDAPVTLVEYGDYQCPYCGRAHPIVRDIQEQLGDKLRFVFRNFPLTEIHPNAGNAALAAEAAGAQGKFWEMHHLLFQRQRHLEDSYLKAMAIELGLDEERLMDEVLDGVYIERVQEDFMSGVRSGVNGTPTFFINGKRYNASWEGDNLLRALEVQL